MRTLLKLLVPVLILTGCAAARDDSLAQPSEMGEPRPTADLAANVDVPGSEQEPPAVAPDEHPEQVYDDTYDEVMGPLTEADARDLQPQPEPADPARLAAEALEACESARLFWEGGDIESALATLDRAYALMLELPSDDPEFYQERADLRHLISRRVVEIYRSRLTSAVDLGSPIPLEINPHVEREIRSFQNGERDFFMAAYRRSGLYRPMITRMLREEGLPEELSWLPLVESGFKTRALSRARALGMWQFISSTGTRYGLSRSHWVDQRMDPEASTRGAIAYLTELHGMFGDWMTALAGYNCGENRVMRVIRRQQDDYLDHFWDVFEQLPRETARYVPRFLATLLIVKDPAAYGFDLPEPLPAVNLEKVDVARHVRLEDLDAKLGLDKGTLVGLNPELRRGVTPGQAYQLNVPAQAAPTFSARLAELPPYEPPRDTYTVHRVRRGETLSTIARRYGSSVNAIMRANNLRSRNRIRSGQRLKVPSRGSSGKSASVAVASGPAASQTHNVRRGDSLWKLASRYGTTVDRIKRDNGLRSDRLYVGQRLKINTGVPAGSKTYAVRRGDTIGKIAQRHRVTLTAMLRANGLSKSSTIYPGQLLVIPN